MMTLYELLSLILLVAALELDVVAALQVMVSRPLPASVLCGCVLGDPASAAAVGAVLEMVWLGRLPVGSVVPPDQCLAGAAGGAAAVVLARLDGVSGPAAAGAALVLAVPMAYVGGWAEGRLRNAYAVLARRVEAAFNAGDARALGRGMAKALALRFFLGTALAALALALALPLAQGWVETFSARTLRGLEIFYWLCVLLSLAVLLDYFWERKNLKTAAVTLLLFSGLLYGLKVVPVAVVPLAALAGIWAFWNGPRRGRSGQAS